MATALAFCLSFAAYRPDRVLPFDFIDFSEFLPFLQRNDGWTSRFGELLAYYAGQGRFSPVALAGLVAKWGIWGDYSPGWQWLRFATMWAIILLTYRLLRRLGASRRAGLAGAAVFLFAPPSVDGFTRLTMAEPAGTLLLLATCFLALRVTADAADEWRIGVWVAAASFVLVLLKEMLAATLVLPIALVAVSAAGNAFRSRRFRTIAVATAGAVLLAGLPVAIVALRATRTAFTSVYGSKFAPPGDVVAHWTLGISPFSFGSAFPPSMAGLALLVLLALLATGWVLHLRVARGDGGSPVLLLIGLLFPLLGATIYVPWPMYNRFYAIPYLLGGAILAAVALSAMERRSAVGAIGAYALWTLFLLFAAADAGGHASRMAVRQQINLRVITRLSETAGAADTVFLATDQRSPERWQELGPTLQRYGEALGRVMPHVVNLPCADGYRRALEGRTAVMFYHALCPSSVPGDTLVARFRRFRLPALLPVTDSIRVDLVIPSPKLASGGY